MLKLTIAVVAVALAGSASAAGWRSLRIDASSDASLDHSLTEFREELTNGRRYAFGLALQEIWVRGTKAAEANGREYTVADYRQQLDGLSYEQVVRVTDPTGEKARRYRAAYNPYAERNARQAALLAARPHDGWANRPAPIGPHGEQVRGTVDTGPAYQHQLMTLGQGRQ
jgi:hypothetical protein